jgi:DNA polymerase-3 subunit alpha
MTTPQFIHLRVHSAYSLAEGAIKTGKLIDACVKKNMPAIAVTDTNNLFGAMDFCLNAVKKGIQPILGMQASLCLPVESNNPLVKQKHVLVPMVLLVQDETGYRNLCRLNSHMYTDKNPQDEVMLTLEMLAGLTDGLICLTGGANGPLAHHYKDQKPDAASALLKQFKKLFPWRLYIELTRHGNWSRKLDKQLIELAHKEDLPLVATNNVYFLDPSFYDAHDALLCIADGRYITETDRRHETPDHYLKSEEEMVRQFHDVPEAIHNTVVIAQRCHYFLKEIKPELPKFATEQGRTEEEELVVQATEGLKWRLENYIYPTAKDDAEKKELEKIYTDRLNMELPVIIKMGFPGYFLIVSDFIKWAKANNIPVGPGRGSGAGSTVAWALQITDTDPIPYGLLFERFLNPERVSLPDFDIDFCQERRDEVIGYVQKKYGKSNVGQIITFGELKARAVVRDVGRVLQMPYGQVDRISKMIPNNPAKPTTLQEAIDGDPELRKLKDTDETVGKLLAIALQLEGLYRHASTHAAGIVIGNKPLEEIVPLYQDPRSTLPATQYNLKYIEQAGLLKFDFLGLKTLTVLQKALQFIKETTDQDIDLLKLTFDDPKVYELFRRGQTHGIFQFESSGIQEAMKQVKPTQFGDLVALNALYRPGPMQNIPQYGKVKNGQASAEYPHPKIAPILEETYGIMVYQEQVMEISRVLAGYTLGGADLLRRAMGKKIKAEMDAQRERFVAGAIEHSKATEDQATAVFDLMARFADYGFNKSHSVAYSIVAYQTAYLKANYPVQFMAALMTLDMQDTDKLTLYAQELNKMGIQLLPPDINASKPFFAVEETEKGKAVRYALAGLKGVGQHAMEDLVAERDKQGSFKDLLDFISRVNAQSFSKKQLEVLSCAGAMDSFGVPRAALYEASDYLMRRIQRRHDEAKSNQVSLFGAASPMGNAEPLKLPDVTEWPAMEKLQHEFSAVGFYLSSHPVDNYTDWLEKKNFVSYRHIVDTVPPMVTAKIAAVVVKKNEKRSDRGRFAFVTVSDRTGVFDVTVYTEPLMQYRDILTPGNLLAFNVDVQWREQEPRFIVRTCQSLDQAMAKSINKVHLALSPKADAVKLSQYLAKCGQGSIKVSLDVPLQDQPGTATLSFPQGIKLMDTDIQALRAFSGVNVTVQ